MKNRILALVLMLASALTLNAQPSWRLYRSYHVARQSVVDGKRAYVLYDGTYDKRALQSTYYDMVYSGNLALWDLEQNALVRTYDRSDGLSDYRIAHIAYSKEANRLVIVYDNGNIDLLDEDDNVINLPHLMKATSLGAKTIYDLCIDGNKAYISTTFGLIVVNVAEAVIESTFNLHFQVYSTTIGGGRIHMSTEKGLLSAPIEANLNDASVLTTHNTANYHRNLVYHSGKVYGHSTTQVVSRDVTTNALQVVTPSVSGIEFRDLICQGNKMFAVSSAGVMEIDMQNPSPTTTKVYPCSEYALSANYDGKTLWMCNGIKGFSGYSIKNDELVETEIKSLQVDGPPRDLAYHPHFDGEKLLVAGGVNTMYKFSHQETGYWYENGNWTVLDEEGPRKKFPNANHMHSLDLVQDPNDANHHYLSICRNGLQEYRNGKFVTMYTAENSPLCKQDPSSTSQNLTFCSALKYDDKGTLWMANQFTDTIIRYILPDGKWGSIYFDELKGAQMQDDYLFTSSGVIFLNHNWIPTYGIFGFTVDDKYRPGKHKLISKVVNQRGTFYETFAFYAMAEDHDGKVWVGTDQGLFVIEDPTSFFDEDFCFTQIIINREDGSGTADYLLNGIGISCITVDYANRKWIGTTNEGVYLISADGQELLAHFTKEDEGVLMPSNQIQGIAINPSSGEVMIATSNGLCSYMGDATLAATDLDYSNINVYPNPVRPEYYGNVRVTGLTANADVKILSSSGQLVAYGHSNGGMFQWDCCNRSGNRVASGIYHVVCSTEDGSASVVARLVVIR